MAKLRCRADERREADFLEAVQQAQVKAKRTKLKPIAEDIDMPYSTFWNRYNNLDTLTLGELRKLLTVILIPPEALLRFVGYNTKQIKLFIENAKEVTSSV